MTFDEAVAYAVLLYGPIDMPGKYAAPPQDGWIIRDMSVAGMPPGAEPCWVIYAVESGYTICSSSASRWSWDNRMMISPIIAYRPAKGTKS